MRPFHLVVLREGALERVAPVDALPCALGSADEAGLVLEGAPAAAGEISLSSAGNPEFWPAEGDDYVRLKPGARFEVGSYTLYPVFLEGAEGGEPSGLLRAVLDLVQRLWENPHRDAVPQLLLETLREAFDADWGAFLRRDEPEAEPEVVCTSSAGRGARGDQVSRTVLAQLEEADGPTQVMDVGEDPALASAASIPTDVRSVVAGRLEHGGREVGVVYLESHASRREFTRDEHELLASICAFAADLLARARSARVLAERSQRLKALHRLERTRRHGDGRLLGESTAMAAVRDQVRQAAARPTTTVILGESGTGKEMVAQALHDLSDRREGPFVAVNCAGLPANLVESELFGHARGAFTGAETDRPGRFELADGGTLFLDELGELPLEAQGTLLRVLEERVVQRIGDPTARPVDVRLVCATNVDLARAAAEGKFREDLWFRVAVVVIDLPPLRDRRDDVATLAGHFLARFAAEHRREITGIRADALDILTRHPWPGNVRELRNVMEQACVREEGPEITPESFTLLAAPRPVSAVTEDLPTELVAAREIFERRFLIEALEATAGDLDATLARLGVSRTTFYDKCKAYGIEPGSYRG